MLVTWGTMWGLGCWSSVKMTMRKWRAATSAESPRWVWPVGVVFESWLFYCKINSQRGCQKNMKCNCRSMYFRQSYLNRAIWGLNMQKYAWLPEKQRKKIWPTYSMCAHGWLLMWRLSSPISSPVPSHPTSAGQRRSEWSEHPVHVAGQRSALLGPLCQRGDPGQRPLPHRSLRTFQTGGQGPSEEKCPHTQVSGSPPMPTQFLI